jgi:hypothetical protein
VSVGGVDCNGTRRLEKEDARDAGGSGNLSSRLDATTIYSVFLLNIAAFIKPSRAEGRNYYYACMYIMRDIEKS